VGLNLHFGFTGLLNFGHVAFMAVGAYTMAIVVDSGLSLWLGIPAGMLAAVVLGVLLGIPTLRLRADYLAITTIAVGEIIRISIRSNALETSPAVCSASRALANEFFDLNPFGPGSYGIWRITFSERQLWVMVVGWGLAVLCTLLIWALMRAPWGRVVKAIREDEDAARSLGKNAFVFKIQSLCIGGAIGALAGMLLAIEARPSTPTLPAPDRPSSSGP
jgi:neutral amino acid transport system permease protein